MSELTYEMIPYTPEELMRMPSPLLRIESAPAGAKQGQGSGLRYHFWALIRPDGNG